MGCAYMQFDWSCLFCCLQAWYEKTSLGRKRARLAKRDDDGGGKGKGGKGKGKKKGKKKK